MPMLELLQVNFAPPDAYEFVATACETREDHELILSGIVMLCGVRATLDWVWAGQYAEREMFDADAVEARLLRDWVYIGKNRRSGWVIRAEWLDGGTGHVALLLDCLTASSEIRRTYRGTYYVEQEWQKIPPSLNLRESILWYLRNFASSTLRALHIHLAAAGVKHAHDGSVAASCSLMKRAGLVANHNGYWAAVTGTDSH